MTFAAIALATAALVAAAAAVRDRGTRLFVALWVLAAGAGSINPLVEAVAFQVMPLVEAAKAMAGLGATAGMLAGLAVALSRALPTHPTPSGDPVVRPRNIAAVAACYTVLYVVAGMLVFPMIKEFYAGKELPTLPSLVALQLVRGALYALYALPWLKLGPAWPGLILGLIFAVLGGVAPLLADGNPYMPSYVRYWHMVEVGVSNFLFGLIAARLLTARPEEREASSRSTAAG